MVPEAETFFGRRRTWHIFQERYVTPYVLQSITVSPQPGWLEEAEKFRWHAAIEAAGMNGFQGTPWSEELDGKVLHGAAGGEYDQEPRGSALSCARSQHNPSKHLQIRYCADFKGGGVFA